MNQRKIPFMHKNGWDVDAGDGVVGLDLVFSSPLYAYHSQLVWISLFFSLKTLTQNSSFYPSIPPPKFIPKIPPFQRLGFPCLYRSMGESKLVK